MGATFEGYREKEEAFQAVRDEVVSESLSL